MSNAEQTPGNQRVKQLLERLFIQMDDMSENGIPELADGTRTIRFKNHNMDYAVKKSQNFVRILQSSGFINEDITIDKQSLLNGIKISNDKVDFEMQSIGSHIETILKPKMLFNIDTDSLSRNVKEIELQAGGGDLEARQRKASAESHRITVANELGLLFNEFRAATDAEIKNPSISQYVITLPVKDNVPNTQAMVDALKNAGVIGIAPNVSNVILSDSKKANISNDISSLKINIIKKTPHQANMVIDFTIKDAAPIDIKALKKAVISAKSEFHKQQQKYSICDDYLKDKLAILISSVKKAASADSELWTSLSSQVERDAKKSFSMVFNIDSRHNPELTKIAHKLIEKFKDGGFISDKDYGSIKSIQDGFNINNGKCSLSGKFEDGKLTIKFAPKEELYIVMKDMEKLIAGEPNISNRLPGNGKSPGLSL